MSAGAFLVARLAGGQAGQGDLDWLATGQAPFQPIDVLDLDPELVKDIHTMYVAVYSSLGDALLLPSADALLWYDRWILLLGITGRPIGFVLCRQTTPGLKLCLAGQDGSQAGRAAVLGFLRRACQQDGVYAEVSPPLEGKLEGYAPEVPFEQAMFVLAPLVLQADADGDHYTRDIPNVGARRKVLLGKPWIQS